MIHLSQLFIFPHEFINLQSAIGRPHPGCGQGRVGWLLYVLYELGSQRFGFVVLRSYTMAQPHVKELWGESLAENISHESITEHRQYQPDTPLSAPSPILSIVLPIL